MQPQGAPHDLRDDDVPLDLVDPEEEQEHPESRDRIDHERVGDRNDPAEPRAEIRNGLGECDPGTEEGGVAVDARDPAERAEEPDSDPGARADDRRQQELPAYVARDSVLHMDDEPGLPGPRREALVEG